MILFPRAFAVFGTMFLFIRVNPLAQIHRQMKLEICIANGTKGEHRTEDMSNF